MGYPISFEAPEGTVEYYDKVGEMNQRATAYLESFKWCRSVRSS
ncbi:hypothetical protein SAMN06265348_12330 [Pedobacter westerhofensis]|uniref:Uncharacterized protein n=1 Tax=Pedobacter westerhofensis TaxID=425512 RepID=A0A521FTJ7_9SPHI|nr:hypothetical protein SAMN06265348_12330 [Pedobacter westerhofensis]